MGQPRIFDNEVKLEDLIEEAGDQNYYYFPIDTQIDRGPTEYQQSRPLTDLLELKDIKIVNNGIRTYPSGSSKRGMLLVIDNQGDILGEISSQLAILLVARYSYESHRFRTVITKELRPIKKKAKRKSAGSTTEASRVRISRQPRPSPTRIHSKLLPCRVASLRRQEKRKASLMR